MIGARASAEMRSRTVGHGFTVKSAFDNRNQKLWFLDQHELSRRQKIKFQLAQRSYLCWSWGPERFW
jgi:hypothetical protein